MTLALIWAASWAIIGLTMFIVSLADNAWDWSFSKAQTAITILLAPLFAFTIVARFVYVGAEHLDEGLSRLLLWAE
jgi:hypothetical protein